MSITDSMSSSPSPSIETHHNQPQDKQPPNTNDPSSLSSSINELNRVDENKNDYRKQNNHDLINKPELCPYSIMSLKLYLTFPTFKLGQLLGLSNLINCLIILVLYTIIIDYLIAKQTKKFYSSFVTLVKHKPKPDHPHDTSTTNKVITISLILSATCLLGINIISNNISSNENSNFNERNFLSSSETTNKHDFAIQARNLLPIGIYLILLSFFHFSEYFVTSLTNPSTLTLSSFLINQVAYCQAISFSIAEYLIELLIFPQLKGFNYLSILGLLMVIGGEIVRKCAMFTASKNFTHSIKSTKDPDHQLITHGIYKFMRHPSYAGWYYWAIGSQFLLSNPICIILFTVISNCFFYDRIDYEEELLIEFFGQQYRDYKKKVPILMPLFNLNYWILAINSRYKSLHRRTMSRL